jgi:ribosomal-protein-alanine N-acetyltransferase
MTLLDGPRVALRPWRQDDLEPFAALNADPAVMEFLPGPLTREQAASMIARMQSAIDQRGWGFWAVDLGGRCIGFTGITHPRFEAHFTPCVEIGWRLARDAWGHGYATEAAGLALDYGFGELGLREIVAFTTVANVRSRRVMEKLGMQHRPEDDFDHPNLPGHPLQRHVLYRLSRDEYPARHRPE